ncbi:hypothetical protein PCYB_083730 [Plasmodium cynomolgi strain B]|uniref:Uncharacterized protein n=1 Tax=Plasmodium cynomolgi (strain B) TaxID=1120755 RepID=K6VAK0_PLACD|nr:hypothetical protein PCYB_083730 [Plasmodium cynomolgi strain B]GAB66212.1 hypothetical protein PCYB_083730 [Plasmodium cynomolgi strain B]
MESLVGNGVGRGMGSLVEGGDRHYAMPRDEDIDEFLNKVNDVTEKVQHILSGKITVEEMQQEEQKLLLQQKIKQMREAEKKEEERRRYVMGTRGSGTKESNYKCFCTHCLVEYKYNQQRRVAHAMNLKGNDYFRKRNYIQAIECYEEAMRVCKDYLEIYNNVALCYLKTHRYDNAIQRCDEVIKYYEVFKGDFRTLKGVKKSLKRSEEIKLAFYSNVYSIDHSGGGTCGGVASRKGRTTFLSFCADKLEELLSCVKRGQTMEGDKLPKYTSLSAITLIDLITLILDDQHQCADFCLNAVDPVITLYQLKKINKEKAAHFLNSIGRDSQGRRLLHERIIQQGGHILLGKLLTRIGQLIAEERSGYTKEQRTRLVYLTECIIKLESVRSYGVDLRGVIRQGGKGAPERSKKRGSDAPKEGDPWKELQKRTAKMHKHKFELANLFGIISHLTLKQDGRTVLEKKFLKDIFNIIIYVNEFFYSCQDMNCNCLSLLVNLVGSANIRSIVMRASWPHMLHFVEKVAPGGEKLLKNPLPWDRLLWRTPPGGEKLLRSPLPWESLLENVLSLLFNLTSTWKEQIREEGDGESAPPGERTLIREASMHRMISCMDSTNMRVAELCCLILSRFYTYAYCGVVEIDEGKSVAPSPEGRDKKVYQGDHYVSVLQEGTSNEDRKIRLVDSLKRKIEKENEQQVHLDEYSFDSMKKSILSELDSPRGASLTNACINLLCCLSKYTDFLSKLILHGEESNLERLTNRLVSLFIDNKSGVERDDSTSIMVKNVAALFTQMIKMLTLREDSSWGSASVVKSIERVIPHAAELVNNGIHRDATSKGISFFLSYCFVNERLKSAVLAAFHNDVGRVCAVLRCGGGRGLPQ